MKYFIVGDIHGCYDELLDLMRISQNLQIDQYIFLGDYIDRGPKSREVITFVESHLHDERYVFLRGNHELMLSEYLRGKNDSYLLNGYEATMRSVAPGIDPRTCGFGTHKKYLEQINRVTENLPAYHRTHTFVACHGNIMDDDPEGMSAHDLLWAEDAVKHKRGSSVRTIISGHTPFKEAVRISKNGHFHPMVPGEHHVLHHTGTLVIDTACFYTGKLTGLYIDSHERKVEVFNSKMERS